MMRMFPVRAMEAMIGILAIRTAMAIVTTLCSIHYLIAAPTPWRLTEISIFIVLLLPFRVLDFRQILIMLINAMFVPDEHSDS